MTRVAGDLWCKAGAVLFIILLGAFSMPFANAADFRLRPDLEPHLRSLKLIYPPEGPHSVLAQLPNLEDGEVRQIDQFALYPAEPEMGTHVIELSGPIVKGDAGKLSAFLDSISGPSMRYLVFNSPGGDFLEGFKIADSIRYNLESQDPNIGGVFVLKNTSCVSACALAFSLSVDMVHPFASDARYVEKGAELGFHMAYLAGDQGAQVERIDKILAFGYQVTEQYSKLIGFNINPPELMMEALKHSTADSFFYLRGGINTWNLGFSPVSNEAEANLVHVGDGVDYDANEICNAVNVAGRSFKAYYEVADLFQFMNSEFSLSDLKALKGRTATLYTDTFSCQLSVTPEGALSVALWRGKPLCLQQGPGNEEVDGGLQGWCASRKVVSAPVTLGLMGNVLGCSDNRLVSKNSWASENGGPSGRVKSNVNFRSSPDVGGQILGMLPAGATLSLTGCMIRGDKVGIWYQGQFEGQTGWVSARYISPNLYYEAGQFLPITRRVKPSWEGSSVQ